MDEELLRRLQDADPARTDVPAASWIHDLMEAAMDETTTPARRRSWVWAGAAAAAVVVVGGGAFALLGDDDTAEDVKPHQELALALPASDPMMMCIQFSPEALQPMEVAFSGEVYEVEGETVRLTPDHWYKGGDGANDVVLTAGSEAVLLEGGITFTEGERYLVSASDGTVSSCGFSGPYTEELAAAFDEAF